MKSLKMEGMSNATKLAWLKARGFFHDEPSLTVRAQNASPRDDGPQLLLTVGQVMRRLGIGRSHLYKILGRGELKSVKVGGCRRIPAQAVHDYIEGRLENAETM